MVANQLIITKILGLLVPFVAVLCPVASRAQDLHFTQYQRSNTTLNPALTGNFDGDIKLTALFRSQWAQVNVPMKTGLFSIEKNFLRKRNDLGLGLTIMEDQTGARQLQTTKALLAVSYQFILHKNFFRFGVQAGMANKRIDFSGQTFPSQWNYETGKYETGIQHGESGLQNSTVNPEVNAGVSWSKAFRKTHLTAGYALFYLNKPKDKILSFNHEIPYRHVLHLNAVYKVSESFSVVPHILYMRTLNALDLIAGSDFSRYLTGDSKITAGAGYRGSTYNSDAAYLLLGYQKSRIAFSFSMDFNISLLSRDTRRKSAWEICIAYVTPARKVKERTIPCERY